LQLTKVVLHSLSHCTSGTCHICNKQQYNLAVDMLEEAVSDEEEAPKKSKKGGQKRKR